MKVTGYVFDGQGKSFNADVAEQEGRYPITRAARIVKKNLLLEHGVKASLDDAKKACLRFWKGEWHHTGLYGKRTNYYD